MLYYSPFQHYSLLSVILLWFCFFILISATKRPDSCLHARTKNKMQAVDEMLRKVGAVIPGGLVDFFDLRASVIQG